MEDKLSYIRKAEQIDLKYNKHLYAPAFKSVESIINDGVPDPVDKYTMFNEWCSKEGVIMPKLEYPAFFDGGLIGIRCTEDIQHREAYILVPLKMLMSIKKA